MTRALVAALIVTLLAVPSALAHRGGDDEQRNEHAARLGTVVSVDATAGTVTIKVADATRLQPGDRVVVKARALRLPVAVVPRVEDDEVEVDGKLTSLSPLTVTTEAGRMVICTVPPGVSLARFSTGMPVEM